MSSSCSHQLLRIHKWAAAGSARGRRGLLTSAIMVKGQGMSASAVYRNDHDSIIRTAPPHQRREAEETRRSR